MKRYYGKFISSVLLFGSNGIVASHIALGSHEIVLWRTLIGSLFLLAVFTAVRQGTVTAVPPGSLLPLLLLGFVNTGFGCYLYFSSMQSLPAQSVAICGYLEPLSALLLSAVLLGERLTPVQMAGAALILGGAAFGEFFGRKESAPTGTRTD